jgi:hypothetical protein
MVASHSGLGSHLYSSMISLEVNSSCSRSYVYCCCQLAKTIIFSKTVKKLFNTVVTRCMLTPVSNCAEC